jgi:hypothetical protein
MYAFCACALLWSIQSLRILSLTPLFSTAFNTHLYILYLHICGMQYYGFLFLSRFP